MKQQKGVAIQLACSLLFVGIFYKGTGDVFDQVHGQKNIRDDPDAVYRFCNHFYVYSRNSG